VSHTAFCVANEQLRTWLSFYHVAEPISEKFLVSAANLAFKNGLNQNFYLLNPFNVFLVLPVVGIEIDLPPTGYA
jgi:hypothetical protein